MCDGSKNSQFFIYPSFGIKDQYAFWYIFLADTLTKSCILYGYGAISAVINTPVALVIVLAKSKSAMRGFLNDVGSCHRHI